MNAKKDEQKKDKQAGLPDAADAIRRNRPLGIVVAAAMAVLGVLFVVDPLGMAYITEIFAMCGFIVYGAFRIATYIWAPAGKREGWALANGIISVIIGILIITAPATMVVMTFAFLIGFLAISSGINQIAISGAIKRETGTAPAWIVVSGVINLVLGIFFIISPFALTAAAEFIFGIYLIVGGGALLVEALGRKS